jgi:hypothetical protein
VGGGARRSRAQVVMSGIDRQALLGELEAEFGAEARDDLERLVDDWVREGVTSSNPDAVLRFQREDLEARTAGLEGQAKADALRAYVLARRADELSGRTFALGKEILAGHDEDGRARGEALREEADALAGELDRLPPSPALDPIRRTLGDAVMEALYAIERKAMSPRLAREQGAAGAPPDVR